MKKTIRNKQSNISSNQSNPNLHINLELPDELKEDYYNTHIQKQNNVLTAQPSIQLSYNIDNNIPYGCLKGGIKKTYRSYKKEFSSSSSHPSPKLLTSTNTNKLNNLSERELKLHKLKEKVFNQHKFIHNKTTQPNIGKTTLGVPQRQTDSFMTAHVINNTVTPTPTPTTTPPQFEKIQLNNLSNISTNVSSFQNNISSNCNNNSPSLKEIPTIRKKITTIRKYKLGKSKHNRTIGILLKDAQTKNKIMEDYKEIKNTNINDIKKYLHKNNLLKYGSTAPNDVTRKIYENSVLAGEIVNINTDAIIHNMSNNKSHE